MIGIYKIINPINEVYIGQSVDIDLRIYNHKRKSSNSGLRKSIEKYGWVNHRIEILSEYTIDELNQKEEFFIKKHLIEDFKIFNNYFTATNGGRNKLTNQRYTVRCHPKVINDIRRIAKQKSQEEFDKEKKEKL